MQQTTYFWGLKLGAACTAGVMMYHPADPSEAPHPPPQAYPGPPIPPSSFQPPVPAPTSVPYWATAAHERATYTYTPRPVVKLPPSCLRCKKSKVRCDRNFPCERCRRLNFDCIPQFRPQGRPMKMGRLIGENGGELCFPGTQHLLQDLYIRVNPRVGVISVARNTGQPSLPVPSPAMAMHIADLAKAWLAGDEEGQPKVDRARAQSLLLAWRSYNECQQRDCTEGLLPALTEALESTPKGGGGGEDGDDGPSGVRGGKAGEDADRLLFDRFVTRAQWDKDGSATCWVMKTSTMKPARLMVRCNDRFTAQFMSREEMEMQLLVLLPELVWERLAHESSRKAYLRMVAEVGLTVPGLTAEACQMLTVKDRYGMEMTALVRLGLYVSRLKTDMAAYCSVLPLPHDPSLMSSTPQPVMEDLRTDEELLREGAGEEGGSGTATGLDVM